MFGTKSVFTKAAVVRGKRRKQHPMENFALHGVIYFRIQAEVLEAAIAYSAPLSHGPQIAQVIPGV
ncbi:MAG: hypothetical protein OHK0029_03200 [Armatimonadaceae bacterium]